MLRPSSLIRFAVFGGIALLVRAIIREANDARQRAAALPPPDEGDRAAGPRKGRATRHSGRRPS